MLRNKSCIIILQFGQYVVKFFGLSFLFQCVYKYFMVIDKIILILFLVVSTLICGYMQGKFCSFVGNKDR